ncbi:MAG: hypothetical protein JXR19_07660 [Bacteroidia bacterium]
MNKICIIVFLLLVTGVTSSNAQEPKQMSITLLNESIALPFTSYTEFHPGIEIGYTLRSIDKKKSVNTISGYGGWFLHQHIQNAFYLRGEYLYEIKMGANLRAGMYGGIGYMHTFYPGPVYEMDAETGEFSESSQFGRPRALATTGLHLSWHSDKVISPFLRQEFSVETPFANGILVMPHSFLKIGITIKL